MRHWAACSCSCTLHLSPPPPSRHHHRISAFCTYKKFITVLVNINVLEVGKILSNQGSSLWKTATHLQNSELKMYWHGSSRQGLVRERLKKAKKAWISWIYFYLFGLTFWICVFWETLYGCKDGQRNGPCKWTNWWPDRSYYSDCPTDGWMQSKNTLGACGAAALGLAPKGASHLWMGPSKTKQKKTGKETNKLPKGIK